MIDPRTVHEPAQMRESGVGSSQRGTGGVPLDRWARIALKAFDAPLAMISLMVGGYPVLKGRAERPEAWPTESGSPGVDPFCRQIAISGRLLVIPDAERYRRGEFAPATSDEGWSAYLGTPLFGAQGRVLGVLSLLDPHPRAWSPEDTALLADLSSAMVTEVESLLEPENLGAIDEFLADPHPAAWQPWIESMPGPAWVLRNDGDGLAFNQAWIDLTGMAQAENSREQWLRAIHPDDRDRSLKAWERAVDSGERAELSCRLQSADGSDRWFLVSFAPHSSDDEQATIWLASATDIQPQKKAESELRYQVDLIETLTKTITSGLCLLDADGRLTFMNSTAELILGWTSSELENLRLEDLLVPRGHLLDPHTSDHPWPPRHVLETGVIVRDREGEWVHRNGHNISVLFSCSPILRDGQITGAVLAIVDITEIKQSTQDLLINRERLDLVIRSTELGLWYCDLPFDRLRWNAKCKEHFGLPPETQVTIGMFFDRLHPDDRERTRQAIETSIEEKIPYNIEYRTEGLDGKLRWIRAIGKAFHDSEGRPIRFDGVTVDITERRLIEDSLLKAKEMAEAASHAKDQFLAALSHELRTPLTPVLVNVTAMLEDPETPESVRPTLEITSRNIALEARLIDDLLDVTRISQGKLRLQREVVDAHELAYRALELCRDEIGAAGLQLEFNLGASECYVEADPARLQQMIWNLIKNAIKFTPKLGLILIRSRNENPPPNTTSSPHWIIEVSDTGIGIEPTVLRKIFNTFEQGDPAVTQRFGGLGLGLAISRSLAEAHGGSLSAWSPGRNQGATFTLRLPTVTAPQKRSETSASCDDLHGPVKTLRLLLVEDNPDTLRVMTRLLRRRGYVVTTADSVRSALDANETSGPFDLVVSDIGLPDGSGLEVIRQIRKIYPLPGIALSGFGMEEDLRRSDEAGFVVHLTKPVDFPTLDAAIRRIGRSRTLNANPQDTQEFPTH